MEKETNQEPGVAVERQVMPPDAGEYCEPDINTCPGCGGPADNGHDRCIPPSPYYCTKCETEAAE